MNDDARYALEYLAVKASNSNQPLAINYDRLQKGAAELRRLARLGAAVEAMPPWSVISRGDGEWAVETETTSEDDGFRAVEQSLTFAMQKCRLLT